ncbi:MAG TPA: hypothetical protein VHB48_14360, partial [Chitinophagaceae bacterium]|nr:hypothetical protein [Chitinophagaceae bacterium]
MKIVITLFILMSCCGNVFGRQQFDTAAVVKKQANEMCTGFVNGNIKILAKYTHPVIIKSIGGADKMEATIKQGLEQMKKQGMGFQSVTTGKPS